MTALAITSPRSIAPAPQPQLAADQWVPISEVVRCLAINEGTARRRCIKDWQPKGDAEQRKDHRGRTVWFVHVRVHPDLLRSHVTTGADAPAESAARALMRFPEAKREQAKLRVLALQRFREWRRTHNTNTDFADFVALIQHELKITVSRSQIYEWNGLCPATDDFAAQTFALIDQRGRAGGSSCSHGAWAAFESYYLTLNQLSIAKCWRLVDAMKEKEGWHWPSLSRVKELVTQRIEPQKACYHREGKRAWESQYKAPVQQDSEAHAVGECWESDHSRLDQFIRVWSGNTWVARRPWLTVWRDWRSRRVMGWHIDLIPNGDTIRAALLDALRDESIGPPKFAWMDHGKDYEQALNVGLTKDEIREIREAGGYWYEAARGKGLLGMLQIESRFARPYNHNGKARVESFFNFVHSDFDRGPGHAWCGSKPGDRDADSLKALLKTPDKLPDIEDIRAEFGQWVTAYNSRSNHSITDLADRDTGRLLSPLEFYERYIETRNTLRDREVLALLEQKWERPLKVGKHGISLSFGSRVVRYGEDSPELQPLMGTKQTVFVTYDHRDTTSIRVFDAEMKLICVARESYRHRRGSTDPISVEARKRAWRRQAAQEKRVSERHDVAAMLLPSAELAQEEQRKLDIEQTRKRLAKQGRDVKDAPNVRLVATPLDGQAEAVREADRRIAVGAESQSAPTPAPQRHNLAALMAGDQSSRPAASRSTFNLAAMQAGVEAPRERAPATVNLAAMQASEPQAAPHAASYSIATLLAGGDK